MASRVSGETDRGRSSGARAWRMKTAATRSARIWRSSAGLAMPSLRSLVRMRAIDFRGFPLRAARSGTTSLSRRRGRACWPSGGRACRAGGGIPGRPMSSSSERTPSAAMWLAGFLGDGVEVVDDHFGRALEFGAEFRIGGGDADRAGVEVALADIDAAHGDHGGGAEVELLGAEDGGDDDVLAVADAAVGAEGDAVAEVVDEQRLLGLGEAEFPGRAGVFGGGKRRGAGAAIVAGDEDVVGEALATPAAMVPTPVSATSFTVTGRAGSPP
jgi:hypothetical protein